MPNATNAGVPVVIDGKEYTLSVLTIHDYEWLTNCMRREWLAMSDGTPAARKEAFSKELLSGDGIEWVSSPSGIYRVAYRMLLHEHPEVTVEQCGDWLWGNQVELYSAVPQLFMDSLPTSKGGDSSKKKTTDPVIGP